MSFGWLCTSPALTGHGMCAQVFKKKDVDADELMGLSSAKRGGKKSKKGAEKPAEKPVSAPPVPAFPLRTHACNAAISVLQLTCIPAAASPWQEGQLAASAHLSDGREVARVLAVYLAHGTCA